MTERLPFDPSRMAAAQQAASPTQQPSQAPLSVSEVAQRIARALSSGLPGIVRVVGEISGARQRTHWYFDVKDEQSVLSCALFASAAKRVKTLPSDGAKVVLTGRVEFYAPAGKVTLIVESIEPVGRGSWEAQLRQLLEQARAKGWLDPQRKRPLPTFPRAIAVITSRSAAALQDVLSTMGKRCPAVDALLIDARVQGEAAVGDVVDAFHTAGRLARAGRIDAVIVTRGGGSVEDLWCFNSLAICEAIVRCPVPVVAAIGHETDTTIAELVADERCATPTQAAMRLTPDRAALQRQVASLESGLRLGLRREVEQRLRVLGGLLRAFQDRAVVVASHERRLARAHSSAIVLGQTLVSRLEAPVGRLERALARHAPEHRVEAAQRRLEGVSERLGRACLRALREREVAAEGLLRQFEAVSPQRVLERGYSVTLRTDGSVVRSPSDAPSGSKLLTRLAAGEVRSVVEGASTSKPLGRPRRSDGGAAGGSLFESGS